MSVYKGFLAFFDRSYYLDENWAGWELPTGLAFLKSKMAANMAAAGRENQDFVITFAIAALEHWFWCLNICFQGQGIWLWSLFTFILEPWQFKSKMAANMTATGRKNQNLVITFVKAAIEHWFWCLNICFQGQRIWIWSHFTFTMPSWQCKSKMAANMAAAGRENRNLAITYAKGALEHWHWCLNIRFHGQETWLWSHSTFPIPPWQRKSKMAANMAAASRENQSFVIFFLQ